MKTVYFKGSGLMDNPVDFAMIVHEIRTSAKEWKLDKTELVDKLKEIFEMGRQQGLRDAQRPLLP